MDKSRWPTREHWEIRYCPPCDATRTGSRAEWQEQRQCAWVCGECGLEITLSDEYGTFDDLSDDE